MCRINPVLATDLAITPGVYSDFEQGSDEAIRLPGRRRLWTWSPQWQAAPRLRYLDRLEDEHSADRRPDLDSERGREIRDRVPEAETGAA